MFLLFRQSTCVPVLTSKAKGSWQRNTIRAGKIKMTVTLQGIIVSKKILRYEAPRTRSIIIIKQKGTAL